MTDEKKDLVISTVNRSSSTASDHSSSSNKISCSWDEKVLQSPLAQRIASFVKEDSPTSGRGSGQRPPEEWRTTFVRFGPLSGIFAMLMAIASIAASLGILAGSNHQPTANWSTTPSTYLAVCTAIANLSMRYAAFQGIVIAWWVKATKGATLAKLHWNWRAGTTLRGALTSGRHMGLFGLACLFSTIVAIDGPLLQRSSTVVSAPFHNYPITLNVSMAQEIPQAYSGNWATLAEAGLLDQQPVVDPGFNRSLPTPHGQVRNDITTAGNISLSDINHWYGNAPLQNVVRGCPGQCKGKLKAPALYASECLTLTIPVDYKEPIPPQGSIYAAPPLTNEGFMVAISLDVSGENEAINLVSAFANIDSANECTGTLTMKICSLRSAIGEYDVIIQDGQTILESSASPTILAVANNTPVDPTYLRSFGGHPSTLAGIQDVVFAYWEGELIFYPSRGQIEGVGVGGAAYMRYIADSDSRCPSFNDPTQDVIESLNKMMVYVGASAALEDASYLESHMDPGVEVNYTMRGYQQGNHNIYVTNYWYFFGAALVEIVCIALVAPTYWGWWKIGRACSFSPLEIAKAFQSPLLADCNSNSSGRSLARDARGIKIKYGVLVEASRNDEAELAFGDSTSVVQPTRGMRFGV